MNNRLSKSPLMTSGILIGAGMGGFLDGIIFHQILQFHNMLSARIPPDNLINAKINMFWDGLFHAAVWLMTAIGIFLLWKTGKTADLMWSGRFFGGFILLGFGLFNFIEGIIDHQILNIHHVYEYSANKLPFDLLFLASGLILMIGGGLLIRTERGI